MPDSNTTRRAPAPPHAPWATSVGEFHAVVLAPRGNDRRTRDTVAVQLPETPPSEFRAALQLARARDARVMILTDIAGQADDAAALALTVLPNHERVPLERALAGGWGCPT